MKFEPVKRDAPLVTPKRKRGRPVGKLSGWRSGGMLHAEDRLRLAKRIYRRLHSLGRMTDPHHAALGWWRQIGERRLYKEFGRTDEVRDTIIWMAKERLLRFELRCGYYLYSIHEPVRDDMMRGDIE